MKLGFVTAILPECSLEEVLDIASRIGYDCIEVMCWPSGKAERRYAGVTHIEMDNLDVTHIHQLTAKYKIDISGLGYYPNPLDPDPAKSKAYIEHIRKVVQGAKALGVSVVNTFVGRNPTMTIDDNWPTFIAAWKPIIEHAENLGIKIGIENCPMRFTKDEWPGGKNLAVNPATWDNMFRDIPSANFGLNFDPSHFVLQHMDYCSAIRRYSDKLFHIHAKDARIDVDQLNDFGVFAHPNLWHTPKLPGLGDVDWGQFFSTLTSAGYDGPVCVEVEDRAYEGSKERRIESLVQSHDYLRQFIPRKI